MEELAPASRSPEAEVRASGVDRAGYSHACSKCVGVAKKFVGSTPVAALMPATILATCSKACGGGLSDGVIPLIQLMLAFEW